MVHDDAAVGLDGVEVAFDDERLVSDAGIALVATLAGRLGIEALAGRLVRLASDRPGAANVGRKVMALLYAMLLGADSIDDCEVLRAGRTRRLLGGWLPAPSTLGTFLRAFTFGHVRQLDRLLAEALTRAWRAGAGPGQERLVVDVNSFIGEVHGYKKQGASFGYTKRRGYHPLMASRAGTGEVLHVRLRKGKANSSRGVLRFAEELIARVARAGASGEKLLRADSAFWNNTLMKRLEAAGWLYSISIRCQKGVSEAIARISEKDWVTLEDYPEDGRAQIAETRYAGKCMIVRRTRLIGAQAELWPDWRHFPFLTGAFPLRPVQRQQRLDRDRRPRPQPRALDHRDRPTWPHRPRSTHTAPATATDPWPADPHRPAMDASSPRPLALAGRLHQGARTNTRATRGALKTPSTNSNKADPGDLTMSRNAPADPDHAHHHAVTLPTTRAAPDSPTDTANHGPRQTTPVAVGTAVAGRPPRRSQRAGLPHWAPALGAGGESLLGPGVQDPRLR